MPPRSSRRTPPSRPIGCPSSWMGASALRGFSAAPGGAGTHTVVGVFDCAPERVCTGSAPLRRSRSRRWSPRLQRHQTLGRRGRRHLRAALGHLLREVARRLDRQRASRRSSCASPSPVTATRRRRSRCHAAGAPCRTALTAARSASALSRRPPTDVFAVTFPGVDEPERDPRSSSTPGGTYGTGPVGRQRPQARRRLGISRAASCASTARPGPCPGPLRLSPAQVASARR